MPRQILERKPDMLHRTRWRRGLQSRADRLLAATTRSRSRDALFCVVQLACIAVAPIALGPMSVIYYGLGELAASRETLVSPQTAKTVERLYVREGDFLEIGDLVFALESGELLQQIESVSAQWDVEIELARLQTSAVLDGYEASQALFDRSMIAESALHDARVLWEQRSLELQRALNSKASALQGLQTNLSSPVAVSPVRGFVSAISFQQGAVVSTSDYVEIIDVDPMVLELSVSESIIPRVRAGQNVRAKQPSVPEYRLEGTVTSVGLKPKATRSYPVWAEIHNPAERLRPGRLGAGVGQLRCARSRNPQGSGLLPHLLRWLRWQTLEHRTRPYARLPHLRTEPAQSHLHTFNRSGCLGL